MQLAYYSAQVTPSGPWVTQSNEVFGEGWGLQTGCLVVSELAIQEASGVMALAMIHQQGMMQEVTAWESEVESVMQEMVRVEEEEESDL